MNEQRYARQVLMFGQPGQQRIEREKVGIVGVGGLGSQICQALAYTGVNDFTLVDDDSIELTNLNRLAGAFPSDVGRLKVEVARRHLQQINSNVVVREVSKNLRTTEAMQALIECSVIFGCVDHDGPRLVLTELASAYALPLIDTAAEIFPEENGQPFHFGGRVVVARPGDYCLFCAEQIDREMAKEELESPEVRAVRREHGYGIGKNVPAPSVFALNGIIANLAVMEFIAMTTRLREPSRMLTYKGDRGVVTSNDTKKANCFTCAHFGQRERADVFRYALVG